MPASRRRAFNKVIMLNDLRCDEHEMSFPLSHAGASSFLIPDTTDIRAYMFYSKRRIHRPIMLDQIIELHANLAPWGWNRAQHIPPNGDANPPAPSADTHSFARLGMVFSEEYVRGELAELLDAPKFIRFNGDDERLRAYKMVRCATLGVPYSDYAVSADAASANGYKVSLRISMEWDM